MKIVGFFGFKENIALKSECLNRKISIKIGSFKCRLLTPSLPDNFYEPSLDYRRPLVQPNSEINFNEHLEWGKPYSWPLGESEIFNFKLEIEVDDKTFDDEKKELLIDSTEDWINRLRHNFFAYDYLLEHNRIEIKSSSFVGFHYYIKPNDKKPKEIKSNRENIVKINLLNRALDFKTFKNVLSSTSKNKRLCDEYQLIKNSKIALQDREYRKSLFECASSLELCLTNVLKRKLKVNNEKLKTHILNMNNSIQKKIELLEAIDIVLPSNLQTDVSQVRNRAIHTGKEVSQKQAEKAYKIVKNSLDILIKNKLV